jgi:cytochrome c oxidase subunit 2
VGCNNCHGPESNIRAPSLVNLFGSTRAMANGPSVVADEAYIRESILRPHTRISQGYGESMPAYDGQLSEREIIELLAYIKTMGSGIPVAPPGSPAGPGALPAQAQGTSQTPMAAGAIQYQTERPDITPTTRQGRPAVGAVAAQQEAVGN